MLEKPVCFDPPPHSRQYIIIIENLFSVFPGKLLDPIYFSTFRGGTWKFFKIKIFMHPDFLGFNDL